MKINLLLILSIVFIYFGCEDSEVVDADLGYKEYIVVRSELFADSIFTGVTFTKTLPLEETYDLSKAELKDVFVYLRVDGVQIIPLHYTSDGIYKPLYNIKIRPKSTYELFAKVNGKSIYASTYIPEVPRISKTTFHSDEYVEVYIESRAQECYGSVFYIAYSQNSYSAKSTDFHSIVEAPNSDFNEVILSRTEEIPEQFRNAIYRSVTSIQVYSFDLSFSDYFKTRGNNQPITNSFIQGGDPIAWNVKGENVIGMFIGVNKSRIESVSQ
ncbi:MAG: hypothetical protein HXY50_15655 [Ignavibacteriaceae bacterium]|nr:hypothetical protein [Ignavibacteriaceae bacterium]